MAIRGLLNQSITVYAPAGPDVHAKQSWGTPATLKCRFEQTNKVIAGKDQEQIPINGIIFVNPDVSVALGSKIIFNNVHYRVMVVSPIIGARGQTNHQEIMVQNWNT